MKKHWLRWRLGIFLALPLVIIGWLIFTVIKGIFDLRIPLLYIAIGVIIVAPYLIGWLSERKWFVKLVRSLPLVGPFFQIFDSETIKKLKESGLPIVRVKLGPVYFRGLLTNEYDELDLATGSLMHFYTVYIPSAPLPLAGYVVDVEKEGIGHLGQALYSFSDLMLYLISYGTNGAKTTR